MTTPTFVDLAGPAAIPEQASSAPNPPMLRAVHLGSLVLTAVLCLLALACGLLPGLLAICAGHLLATRLAGARRVHRDYLTRRLAAAIVILLPVLGTTALMLNARGMAFDALSQYPQLLHHLAGTLLEIREKLPAGLAIYLPEGLLEAQAWLVDYLQSQAQALTHLGTAWLRGGVLVYIGLIIGALMTGTPSIGNPPPLRAALRQRGQNFMVAFRQIVVAQFWIAAFNAFCTALLLLVAMPLADVRIPYSGALITLTFIAGMVPIVGNLLCNGILTLAGIAVSPAVGMVCLMFLVSIHKVEYFINAKIIGQRTSTSAWELLTVMCVGEAVFGLSGLVAAPLYYAFAKRELRDSGLI